MSNSANLTSTNSLREPQAPIRSGTRVQPITYGPDHTYKNSSANYNAKINNIDFLNTLIKEIQIKLNRVLTGHEKTFIINKIKNIDPSLVMEHSLGVLVPALRDTILQNLNNLPTGSLRGDSTSLEGGWGDRGQDIDVHEFMKMNIGTTSEQDSSYDIPDQKSQSSGFRTFVARRNASGKLIKEGIDNPESSITKFMGIDNVEKIRRTLNPNSNYRQNYIMFDSRYRIGTYGNISVFSWVFVPNLTLASGSLNIYGTIRDIVALRVFPIRIPYVLAADTEQERISLNIVELSPQGFVAHENRRFHFMLRTAVAGNWIDCQPFNFNDGYYRFQKPISTLNTLSLSFGDPIKQIEFDADRSNYQITYGALVTTITTDINNNLITGNKVYFEDFTTIDPTADADLIKIINGSDGFFITFIAPDQFTIPIDTSSLAPTPPGIRLTVYFGSKRIYVPMEITYIEPE